MSNVVGFGKPPSEPLIWVCASCGCSTFRLYSSGATECASCGQVGADHGDWFRELPEPEGDPKEATPETKVVSFNGSPAAALRTMMRRINPDEMVALIAIMENGRVRTWGGIDSRERAEWLDRRLADARDLLTFMTPKE